MPADFHLQGMFLPIIGVCYKIIKFLLNSSTIDCSELFDFCLKVSSFLYVITVHFLFRYWKDFW